MPRPPHTRSQAADRIANQRAANIRLVRTVILGTIAVTVAIVWLGDQYGIAREETLQYLGATLLFVVGLAGLGFLGFLTMLLVRRLRQRRDEAALSADREKSDQS
ncbi:MAG: hypothetical protein RJQ07_11165 [Pseudomonadales bacterium]